MNIITKKKSNKKWLIAVFTVLTLLIVALLFNYKLILAYYDNLINNKYKAGDDIHAYKGFVNSNLIETVFRLVKDDDNNYWPIISNLEISGDSLSKYQTNIIGKYLGYKIVPFNFKNTITGSDTSGAIKLYIFDPNLKGIKHIKMEKIPAGYSLADNNYYLWNPLSISKVFLK